MSSASHGFGKRGQVTLAQAGGANEPTGGLLGSDNRVLVWVAGAVIAVLLFMLFMASAYRRDRESYRDSEGRVVYVGGGGGGFMSGLLGGMLGYHLGKQAGAAAAQNAAARSMPAAAPTSAATQSTTMQRSGFGSTGSSTSGSGSAGHSAGG